MTETAPPLQSVFASPHTGETPLDIPHSVAIKLETSTASDDHSAGAINTPSTSTSTATTSTSDTGAHEEPDRVTTPPSAETDADADAAAEADGEADGAEEDSGSETDPSRPKISLPPIGHVLQKIDAYQNEQKLHDSQLLLNFKERTNSEYSADQDSDSSEKAKLPNMATFNAHMDITFKSESPSTPTSGKLTHANLQNNNKISGHAATMSVLDIGPDLTKASRHSSVDSQDSESGNATPNSYSGSNSSSKKRTNLPRETIEILNEWVLNNLDNPYPNHTQKRILLEKTGLSNVQLSNWFINKRRRRIFSNLSGNQGQPIKKKRLIDRL